MANQNRSTFENMVELLHAWMTGLGEPEQRYLRQQKNLEKVARATLRRHISRAVPSRAASAPRARAGRVPMGNAPLPPGGTRTRILSAPDTEPGAASSAASPAAAGGHRVFHGQAPSGDLTPGETRVVIKGREDRHTDTQATIGVDREPQGPTLEPAETEAEPEAAAPDAPYWDDEHDRYVFPGEPEWREPAEGELRPAMPEGTYWHAELGRYVGPGEPGWSFAEAQQAARKPRAETPPEDGDDAA